MHLNNSYTTASGVYLDWKLNTYHIRGMIHNLFMKQILLFIYFIYKVECEFPMSIVDAYDNGLPILYH